MIITQGSLNGLTTAFNTVFNKAFKVTESHLDTLAMLQSSQSAEDTYSGLGNMPSMREWLGDRIVDNPEAFGYTIKNRTFESTFMVKREDIEDDRIGIYSPVITQMGILSRTHPDELIFGLMKNGFSGRCYDGQYFFDVDHAIGDKSYSNMQTGEGAAWFLLDVSKLIKPFIFQKRRDYKLTALVKENDQNVFMRNEYLYGIDARVNAGYGLWQFAFGSKAELNEANYSAARASMRGIKANNGRPLHVTPNLLVVGPSLEDSARKLLLAQQNSVGASNVYANTADMIVSAWLD